MVSVTHCSFKVTTLKDLWLWEPWTENIFHVQGRELGTSNCLDPAHINWRSWPLKNSSNASWIQNLAPSLTSSVVSPITHYLCLMFLILFFFFYLPFFFYLWWICHTLKWNSQGFTCVPHPNTPSHLPLHPFPLGFPSALGPSTCLMPPTWAGDLFHPR